MDYLDYGWWAAFCVVTVHIPMARKGSQSRNDLDRKTQKRQNVIPESLDASSIENNEKTKEDGHKFADCDRSNGDFLFRSSNPFAEQITDDDGAGTARSCKQRTSKVPLREKSGDRIQRSRKANRPYKAAGTVGNDLLSDASKSTGTDGVMLHGTCNLSNKYSGISSVGSAAAKVAYLDAMTGWSFRSASYALKTASGWIEHQKPRFSLFIRYMHSTYDHVISNIKYVYPVMRTWILHFGKFIFLLSAIWLDCNIRGLNSLLHLGTTSFFTVLWCSLLSIIGMVGLFKVLIMMVAAILVLIFIGIAPAFLVLAIFTTVVLWLYGSFWMTSLVTFFGGVTFGLHHERVAVCVTMLYSLHCARSYMGWLGLFLGLNLSFISSDIFIQVLKRNVNEHRFGIPLEKNTHSEAGADHGFHSHFQHTDGVFNSSSRGSADSSREIPSTSGRETELTSEVEVTRLLNCSDHYSVLGFNHYENIDVSVLKKEYRKRAMLVHPDKNMGNEKAADAFKKLQNAYEVLLDSIKRKNYDDDLRREELLKFVRRFQTSTQKNERHGIFSSESPYFEAEDRGPHGESRRIFCNKCSTFHMWTPIERSKSQARWCQDCKDFHQAKDGDGWLEQPLNPFFFGLLQKVDTPRAYVCAESKIYDATRWFICQGMRCPTNTHKPSFHVNTNLSSKHNVNSKASSSSHRGGGGMPSANMGDAMTQEDFFEWLQNAVSSGMFETEDPHKEGPSGSGNGSTSGGRKKRKGKKQR